MCRGQAPMVGAAGGAVGSGLHDDGAGGVAEGDPLFGEGDEDAAAEFAQDAVSLVGPDAEVDGVDDFSAVDLVDAEDVGVGDDDLVEGGVLADFGGEVFEQGHDFVGVDTGVYADGERGDGVVAGEIGDGGDLAVGDDVDGAVAVAQGGAAEGEVFYGALQACDFDDFAHVVLIFDEDEDAVEHVLEDALGAKADADADDAGGGEERGQVDVEDGQHMQQNNEGDDAVGGGADDRGHSAELGGSLGVADLLFGETQHAVDEKAHDALEEKT